MTEGGADGGGARATPLILDSSVLSAAARGDVWVMTFLRRLDGRGQPFVVPALAVTAAALSTRTREASRILRGIERMDIADAAPLSGAGQATRLAEVITATGLEPWDAHVAAVADALACPVLTLDAGKWRQHASDLEEPLHFVEVADPEDGA